MIFKITMMSGAEIPLENEEAVKRFLEEANAGKKLILTKYGIVNVASVDSIAPDKKKMETVGQYVGMGRSELEAENETLGSSPFAKLIAPKMGVLSDKSRTEIQENVAREERRF